MSHKFIKSFLLRFLQRQVLLFLPFVWGCSFVSRVDPIVKKGVQVEEEEVPSPKSLVEVLQQETRVPSLAMQFQNGELIVQGIKLKNTRFDLPITVNSKVEYWVDYFCGRGRKYFARYLERSEYFIPYLVPILKQNGMPEDLVYLAMIESGFSTSARSHAAAVGPWQFMPGTGKLYGLKINWWIDERRDIEKSTLAAIDYLRNLYLVFGNWEMVAAAYNAGPGKASRARNRFGTSDFWAIARHQFFRPETRNYIPKMMAAAIIGKNREQFGFSKADGAVGATEVIPLGKALPSADLSLLGDVSTSSEMENGGESELSVVEDETASEEEIQPGDLTGVLSQSEEAPLLDLESEGLTEKIDPSLPVVLPAQSTPLPYLMTEGEVGAEEVEAFQVRSPADLLSIASAASLSYAKVKALNPSLLRWCTPPFQSVYRIKLPSAVKARFLEIYNHSAFPREVKFLSHSVKPGDTLSKIAVHFGLRVDPLMDLNRGVTSLKKNLQRGTKIWLPLPEDRSRSLASLGVKDPPPVRSPRKHMEKRKRRLPLRVIRKNASRLHKPRGS